jgi:iron complex outermembrane receptor protein
MPHHLHKSSRRSTPKLFRWLVLTIAAAATGATTQAQTPSGANAPQTTVGPERTARAAAADREERLETVVVTGSSIPNPAYESAPVTIITSDELENSGTTNIEDYFKTQPDFVLSGQSSYSNVTTGSGLNGTNIGGTTLDLRGIGAKYTLVLVNGRRFEAENPANLDLIPLDAIDRIEVLKSGASAVYGSDAVAGVVNIITKRKADGLSVGGYFGESGQRDNDHTRASVSWGTSTDQLNFFGAVEYYKRGGLTEGQRVLSANPDLSRFNPGFNYQTFVYSSLAQIILPDGTGPLVLNQRTFTCGGFSRNPSDYVPLDSHLYATSCDAKLDENQRSLINPQRKGTLFAAVDYKLANGATLYGDFDFARSLTHSVGDDFGVDGFGDPNSPLNLSPIPASNYWNPFGVPIVAVTYGVPEGGPQTLDISSSAWRASLGIMGAVDKIHYDVGGVFYYDYSNVFAYNLPTDAGLLAAENRPGPAAINLFCNACNTAAQLAGLNSGASTQSWEEMGLFNAHAYAPIYTLPSGDMVVAAGAEFQRDTYVVRPSQFILDSGLYDFIETAINSRRDYRAVYVEAQLPIFGNAFTLPGAASLAIDAAARYESIQNAGSRTDPTVSIRWEPIANSLALRASYGTSFRAPSLNAVYAPTTTTQSSLINPVTGQSGSYEVVSGGNPNLKPETASYTTYGIALTPQTLQGLTVLVDRWFINQKNIVLQTEPQLVLDGIQPGSTFTASNGQPGVVALLRNAAGQQVNGTDLDLDYRFRTETVGSFDLRLNGTYLNSFKVDTATKDGFVQYAGSVGLANSLPSITGLPKPRFLFAANWTYRALSATYRINYTGSYQDPTTIPGGVRVDSYTTHDIQFTLDCAKLAPANSWMAGVKFTLGVNDLTYAKVPIYYAGPYGAGLDANGYDPSIVDPTGRFVYAAVRLSFPRHQKD